MIDDVIKMQPYIVTAPTDPEAAKAIIKLTEVIARLHVYASKDGGF